MVTRIITDASILGVGAESLRESYGIALSRLGKEVDNFIVLDADVAGGTGTHHFKKAFPQRFFQFGIAEQNMLAAAAGFAATGLIPFVSTFAVFMLRGYEQIRLSIAYPRRNVKIVASHPGLDVGPDGASAQCLEDIAAMRAIPGMTVVVAADPYEVSLMTEALLKYDGPVYMRTGRSPCRTIYDKNYKFEIGRGHIVRDGSDVTIIACGDEVARSLDAVDILALEGISARVVNMATIKPIDVDLIKLCAEETGCIVTAENHNIYGGLGGAVAEVLATTKPVPMELVGVRDIFGESGEADELARKYGLDEVSIARAAKKALLRKI